MFLSRRLLIPIFALTLLWAIFCPRGNAQAALLTEEPYGFFGTINPTGHNAIYFRNASAR